jgi:hypothetical protein
MTNTTNSTAATGAALASGAEAPRTRTYRKRRHFQKVPRPVYPMRALWESVTEEEREKAHRTCGTILEYWLGVASKTEVAKRLGVPPLRVWQMSQRAVTGMVCGLLRQPRTRRKAEMATDPESDPRALRRRIAALEREIQWKNGLIQILKDLPANKGRKLPARPGDLGPEEPQPEPAAPDLEATNRGTGTKGRRRPSRPRSQAGGGSVAQGPSP